MNTAIHISYDGARNMRPVQKGVAIANDLLRNDDFYRRIMQLPPFDMANVTPDVVAGLMRHSRFTMSVTLYYALSPLKNYDGYDDLNDPSIIHLNAWKTDRSPASICNTIIHSCVHAVNALYRQYSFGHGDMSCIGKENTAPYRIGALAEQMASHDNTAVTQLEHDLYEPFVKDIRKYYF
jgi:hypothetical protein